MNIKNRMSEFFSELEANCNVSDMMKVIGLLDKACNDLMKENASLRAQINDYKTMLNLPPDNQPYSN